MTELALIPGAFLAGLLMFFAPCTLPIVPGYLAFIAAVRVDGVQVLTRGMRNRLLLNALAFVLGFSLLFILLGVFASSIGALLGPWRYLLTRVSGVIIIIFGIVMLGVIPIPALMKERRIPIPAFVTLGTWQAAFFIGLLFAIGWSPCIGPILGTVLLFASTSATMTQGALLLAIFSLGLGIPFIITALGMQRAGAFFARASKTVHILSICGGCTLLVLGALMLFGDMGLLTSWGYSLFSFLHYDRLLNYM